MSEGAMKASSPVALNSELRRPDLKSYPKRRRLTNRLLELLQESNGGSATQLPHYCTEYQLLHSPSSKNSISLNRLSLIISISD